MCPDVVLQATRAIDGYRQTHIDQLPNNQQLGRREDSPLTEYEGAQWRGAQLGLIGSTLEDWC